MLHTERIRGAQNSLYRGAKMKPEEKIDYPAPKSIFYAEEEKEDE